MIKKVLYKATNNLIVNWLLICLRRDTHKALPQWQSFCFDEKKTMQENNGFSHRPDVDETITRIKQDLQTVTEQLSDKKQINVLDIGCGTGLYIKSLENQSIIATGIDVSAQMCSAAQELNKSAKIIHGNFLDVNLDSKFSLIYSISVLEYVPRSQLSYFFKKLHANLEPGGLIYILYPHALSFKDTLYPNLRYIQYSPKVLQRVASRYFDVVEHRHVCDDKQVCCWDKSPYMLHNGTIKNGFVLLAKKK